MPANSFILLLMFSADLINGITIETRKHCCSLGTNYASNQFDCKTYLPEMAGVELANERSCLSMVDVCCKKKYREMQCEEGIKTAKSKSQCSDDENGKECCEACQAGIEAGENRESCTGFGVDEFSDEIYKNCCEYIETTTTKSTSTVSTTTVSKSNYSPSVSNSVALASANENICDSDVCAQICEPLGSSYRCDCFKGYALMEDKISCRPIKRKKGTRCETDNPCDHDCTDTGTAIKCSCRDGYKLAEDNRTCIDVDECETDQHDCGNKEDCINEIGGYSCYEPILETGNDSLDFDNKCPAGYKFDFDKLVCDDIDECKFDLMCVPPKVCKNTIGSFSCEGADTPKCPTGFHFKVSTQACEDVDECLTGDNDCNKDSQVCLNTKGNYTCVDKASRNMCPPGFKKNSRTQACEDIDECEDPDICEEGKTCVNELGGHSCVQINKEKSSPITTSTTVTTTTRTTPTYPTRRTITCPTGYMYSPEQDVCSDINECQTDDHTCQPLERCDNTVGSYICTRIYGCGTGYTLNLANGLCEDDDECELGTHNCAALGPEYVCRNILGSYRCDIDRLNKNIYKTASVPQYDSTATTTTSTDKYTKFLNQTLPFYETTTAAQYSSTTASTFSTQSPLPPTTTPFIYSHPQVYSEPPPYSPSGTVRTQSSFPSQYYTPYHWSRMPTPFPSRSPAPRPPFASYPVQRPYIPPYRPEVPENNNIAPPRINNYPVISGQLKKCLPGYKMNARGECEDVDECESNPCGGYQRCLNFNGRYECTIPMQCKIGFELNDSGDQCVDVNECSRGTHKCNPTQICKNYQGYYTCECPPGHHFNNRSQKCEDLDECRLFRACGSYAKCVNTKGSFRCECKDGFRKNNNLCDDVDECTEIPGLCEHNCINTWGAYRCSCKAGFTLNSDNRTCNDIDECERFKDRRLCIGTCKNIPGSYSCECPNGYKLGADGRVCIDIDECQQNVCSPGDVCLNTRGSYKCYRIDCPKNYVKDTEHKSRCKRLKSVCDPRDYTCQLPEQYTYQYITLVSNLPLPGHVQLFQIKGPHWPDTRAEFSMKLLNVNCPNHVMKADETYFQRISDQLNSMALFLVKSIEGPQEIKLQIQMRMFQGNTMFGNVIVYIIIVVSEYPF